jgi:hypothetical protein
MKTKFVLPLLVGTLVFVQLITASAQEVTHKVLARVPQILQITLPDAPYIPSGEVSIEIFVIDGHYVISPSHTRIAILANSNWQLAASFAPLRETDAPVKLTYQTGETWHRLYLYPQVIAEGVKQTGWQYLSVHYGLDTPLPPDGRFQGLVTYSLARP